MATMEPLMVEVRPVHSSRKRGKFSAPPLWLAVVVRTRPVSMAAFTVVSLAMRDDRVVELELALASDQLVERMVTASATTEAGIVAEVFVVPKLPAGAL